jgi:hypothetical protein
MPEIMLPEGIEIPDGAMPGDEVEFLATVKLGEEGKATVMKLDGLTIEGYEEDGEEMEEEEETETETELTPQQIQAMRQQQMSRGGNRFVQAAMGE